MASIDRCLELLRDRGGEMFRRYEEKLRWFDKAAEDLEKLVVLCHGAETKACHRSFFAFDPGKIVISTRKTDFTGRELADLLRSKFRIEPEMSCADYVLCMTSICDTGEHFERLARAVAEMDRSAGTGYRRPACSLSCPLPKQELSISQALDLEGEHLLLKEAEGAISLEYVWAYPPGIPLIAPGEGLDAGVIRYMKALGDEGVALYSSKGGMPRRIFAKHPRK
jgi:arginine/lysine/ornithine decarboxylase